MRLSLLTGVVNFPQQSYTAKVPSVSFGLNHDVSDEQISWAEMDKENKEKKKSPLFKWMIASNPFKRWAGKIVNWSYWLWQGFVKDLKHIQQSLFKLSKPTEEKP